MNRSDTFLDCGGANGSYPELGPTCLGIGPEPLETAPMPQMALDCPRCGVSSCAFTGVANTNVAVDGKLDEMMVCGRCARAVIVQVRQSQYLNWPANPQSAPEILEIFPQLPLSVAPDHVPAAIAEQFVEAHRCLTLRMFNAGAPLFRKVLESAVKHLAPNGIGNLYQRIKNLPAEIGVTPAMRDWAHEVRLIGNEAVHEDGPVSEADAKDIAYFTELFLTYAYSLPGRLADRRSTR
jgi:hypothetical protein